MLSVLRSLGQLIKIIREAHMVMVVDKLIDYSSSKDEELRDISGLGEYLPGTCVSCATLIYLHSAENYHCRTSSGRYNRSQSLRKVDTQAPCTTRKRELPAPLQLCLQCTDEYE